MVMEKKTFFLSVPDSSASKPLKKVSCLQLSQHTFCTAMPMLKKQWPTMITSSSTGIYTLDPCKLNDLSYLDYHRDFV